MNTEPDSQISSSDISFRLRQLPSVDSLLNSAGGEELIVRFGRELTLEALRRALDLSRYAIAEGRQQQIEIVDLIASADSWLKELIAPTLRPVVNATGVIIHTNLGRAPTSSAAIAAIMATAKGYSTLEYDLESGQRGSRTIHAEKLITRITGAEAALVVNNNAAALLLMLTALCQGREIIISRGQLVEIGGGFRIPDVMAQSGAKLVEVGTTNRTHLTDYDQAISEYTSAILVAHHSNFKVVGFTSEPALGEIAELAHQQDLLMLYDQGSGALLDTSKFGLDPEPLVQTALQSGVDVVTFSGDKLLGGPQAGILCGRETLISQMKRHPLARAVRADKMALAALSATLTRYLTGQALNEIPVWQMIARPLEEIEKLAHEWAELLTIKGLSVEVIDGQSTIGGGSLPGATLPTKLLALNHPKPVKLANDLRYQDPPIIARISEDQLVFDPRTVLPGQEQALIGAIIAFS
ncbi:MAG: L-seryl-tRNA(Sec) selenium transferase [Anaerolineae bacterium SG8_19]|nr:MAG: L-seryl-tRNA(Sec) selenium transferase [Anaerolineae bacterium SG8_19]